MLKYNNKFSRHSGNSMGLGKRGLALKKMTVSIHYHGTKFTEEKNGKFRGLSVHPRPIFDDV